MSKGVKFVHPNAVHQWPELVPEIPPLSEDEYGRLKASMKESGQQYPVLVDENYRILDGNHRDQVAIDLGWDRLLIEERSGLSLNQKRTLALTLNSDRRQLAPDVQARIQAAMAELRRERVAEKRSAGESIRKIAKNEGVSKSTIEDDLKKAGQSTVPPQTVTGQDGRKYDTKNLKAKPKPEPTWQDVWLAEKERLPKTVIAISTGKSGASVLLVSDDARLVAKLLSVKTQEYMLHDYLKLHRQSMGEKLWQSLMDSLDKHGYGYVTSGMASKYSELQQIANAITGAAPTVEAAKQPYLTQEEAAARNALIEHPDPVEAARASIFGETPLSKDGHPISGLPSNGAAPADPDRAEQERHFRQQLMNTNNALMLDKEAQRKQIEAQQAEIEALRAQLAGTPLGLPIDDDPLHEKLLQALWYLDRGMAILSIDRNLSQPDSLILKYCDDFAVRTTAQHYQAIERMLVDDTIDVIREIAATSETPKQAVEKVLFQISKEDYAGRGR